MLCYFRNRTKWGILEGSRYLLEQPRHQKCCLCRKLRFWNRAIEIKRFSFCAVKMPFPRQSNKLLSSFVKLLFPSCQVMQHHLIVLWLISHYHHYLKYTVYFSVFLVLYAQNQFTYPQGAPHLKSISLLCLSDKNTSDWVRVIADYNANVAITIKIYHMNLSV